MRPSGYALMLALGVLAAGAWPGECRAQAKVARVGMLMLSKATLEQASHQSFVQRLSDRGWVPGKNVVLEYRFARGEALRFAETSQRNAVQVANILDGAKPGDLPIERPSQFTFLINVKTVKALGLKVPDSLLLNAEQVGC